MNHRFCSQISKFLLVEVLSCNVTSNCTLLPFHSSSFSPPSFSSSSPSLSLSPASPLSPPLDYPSFLLFLLLFFSFFFFPASLFLVPPYPPASSSSTSISSNRSTMRLWRVSCRKRRSGVDIELLSQPTSRELMRPTLCQISPKYQRITIVPLHQETTH